MAPGFALCNGIQSIYVMTQISYSYLSSCLNMRPSDYWRFVRRPDLLRDLVFNGRAFSLDDFIIEDVRFNLFLVPM